MPVSHASAADWLRVNAHVLTTLDDERPLDDLEPLRDLATGARVLAIGEGAHFVFQFARARRRLIRFLAQRCGFTVLAFEFGFAEAYPLDSWLRGEEDDGALAGMSGTTNSGLTGDMARWLRHHNTTSGHPLELVGLDTPDSGGTLRPALDPVARYLREVDPEMLPTVQRVLVLGERVAARSVAKAAPRWARLTRSEQNDLTASLSRLRTRFRALGPLYVERSNQDRYEIVQHHLEAAVHADYMFATTRDMFAGADIPGDASVRDQFMADSLVWQLRRRPEARVLLVAHNSHIQKTPVLYHGHLAALPLGYYLDRQLGRQYRALALTHTADSVPEMTPDDSHDVGFSVANTPLGPPSDGSIERALVDAGLGGRASYTDLRTLRSADWTAGDWELNRIRAQSMELSLPLPDAFDAVLSVPSATPEVITTFR